MIPLIHPLLYIHTHTHIHNLILDGFDHFEVAIRWRLGIRSGKPYVWRHDGRVMLDYLALICLLALCAGHYYLIRGCMSISAEASTLRHTIDMKLADTNNLLNEIAEILDEVQPAPSVGQPAQTGNPLVNLLLQQFIPKPKPSENYASTESEERPISEIDTTTTTTEESESWEYPSELLGS
jgi:hypothetical protein